MIATDDYRRGDHSSRHEIVDPLAELRAFPIAEPADACRQALVRHALSGQAYPPGKRRIFWKQLQHQTIRPCDVRRIARQSDPSERAASSREQWADVLGHKAGIAKSVREPSGPGLSAKIVAVVESDRAALAELDYRFAVARDRRPRAPKVFIRIVATQQ